LSPTNFPEEPENSSNIKVGCLAVDDEGAQALSAQLAEIFKKMIKDCRSFTD
jgi:hypothetical protein